MKIYMTDQHKWRKYQNGVGKKKEQVKDKDGVKMGKEM